VLETKQSDIDHHEAGDGIFIKTKNGQSVLPGTLIGFYPGMIWDPMMSFPERSNHFIRNFLVRYDNFWIDSESHLAYPLRMNKSLDELNSDGFAWDIIEPEYLNPYSLGHKINHPPPGTSENVMMLDFDIPYTWFPSEYRQHLPYIENIKYSTYNQSRLRKNVLRTVAVVASRFIENGEELYSNYFSDGRVPMGFTADWLVKPPPLSPLLQKKLTLTYIPPLVKLAMKYRLSELGESLDAWEQRSVIEIPEEQSNPIL
jgi:hypothetical protein